MVIRNGFIILSATEAAEWEVCEGDREDRFSKLGQCMADTLGYPVFIVRVGDDTIEGVDRALDVMTPRA